MTTVTLRTPQLTSTQKTFIGDRILRALQECDIPPSSVVVFFENETRDLLLDGGLLFEAEIAPSIQAGTVHTPPNQERVSTTPPSSSQSDFKTRARRTKQELADLKAELIEKFQYHGTLNSFEAQNVLGLKGCEWAPATLRRFFDELQKEGVISVTGQKRGTKYHWNGMIGHSSQPSEAMPLLQRKGEESAPKFNEEISEDGKREF